MERINIKLNIKIVGSVFLGLIISWFLFAGAIISEPDSVGVPVSTEVENMAEAQGIPVVKYNYTVIRNTEYRVDGIEELLNEAKEGKTNIRYAYISSGDTATKMYTVSTPAATYVWKEQCSAYSPSSYPGKAARYNIADTEKAGIIYEKDQFRTFGLIALLSFLDIWIIYFLWGKIEK